LITFLEEDDAEAVQWSNDHRAVLHSMLGEQKANDLLSHLGRFEFEEALDLVKAESPGR
jgi:hypothetical protein